MKWKRVTHGVRKGTLHAALRRKCRCEKDFKYTDGSIAVGGGEVSRRDGTMKIVELQRDFMK
jgi:hypothetical protein